MDDFTEKKNKCRFKKFLLAVLILLLLSACAINPATHRMELMLVSENKEFSIGQKIDKQVREQMGVYLELPRLRAKVKEVVENIGRHSARPDVIYRAEIVDTPDFNAFAVPGGFVYVHRGLLERINSIDELAAVMGHEIAHVAARHSAAQISKMQLLNLGLLGATVATGRELQNFGGLVNLGSVLAFSKFSRDDERQADYLGIQYMTEAGYNPRACIDVMKIIQHLNEKEPDAMQMWFMTHPPTSERINLLTSELGVLESQNPDIVERKIRRNEYIRLLDGMAVGEWNGKELVAGERYYNKEFQLSIPVPAGWEVQINNNNYTAVFADIKNKSYAYFNIEALRERKSTEEYFSEISSSYESKGLKKITEEGTAGKLAHGALSAEFSGNSSQGPVSAQMIAFTKGDNGYLIIGISSSKSFDSVKPYFEKMINGLTFLTADKVAKIEPPRMKIHEVMPGENWDTITKKYYHTTEDKEKLAEYNGFKVDEMPGKGTLLKIPPTLRFR